MHKSASSKQAKVEELEELEEEGGEEGGEGGEGECQDPQRKREKEKGEIKSVLNLTPLKWLIREGEGKVGGEREEEREEGIGFKNFLNLLVFT